MKTESMFTQPTTIEAKYGAMLGILTAIMGNREIQPDSKALDILIWVLNNNTQVEPEQEVLEKALNYKFLEPTFPFGDDTNNQPNTNSLTAAPSHILVDTPAQPVIVYLTSKDVEFILCLMGVYKDIFLDMMPSEEHEQIDRLQSLILPGIITL